MKTFKWRNIGVINNLALQKIVTSGLLCYYIVHILVHFALPLGVFGGNFGGNCEVMVSGTFAQHYLIRVDGKKVMPFCGYGFAKIPKGPFIVTVDGYGWRIDAKIVPDVSGQESYLFIDLNQRTLRAGDPKTIQSNQLTTGPKTNSEVGYNRIVTGSLKAVELAMFFVNCAAWFLLVTFPLRHMYLSAGRKSADTFKSIKICFIVILLFGVVRQVLPWIAL